MDDVDDETHPLVLPEVPIVMPDGELPVVREGTIGGMPAYEAEVIVEFPKMQLVSPRSIGVIDGIGTKPNAEAPAKKKGRKR